MWGKTAEPVSRHQFLRRERGQGKKRFSCSAGHDQDWQPCPIDPYSTESAGHACSIGAQLRDLINGIDGLTRRRLAV